MVFIDLQIPSEWITKNLCCHKKPTLIINTDTSKEKVWSICYIKSNQKKAREAIVTLDKDGFSARKLSDRKGIT